MLDQRGVHSVEVFRLSLPLAFSLRRNRGTPKLESVGSEDRGSFDRWFFLCICVRLGVLVCAQIVDGILKLVHHFVGGADFIVF